MDGDAFHRRGDIFNTKEKHYSSLKVIVVGIAKDGDGSDVFDAQLSFMLQKEVDESGAHWAT